MTLEEAIKHAEAAAIENEKEAKRNREHGGWYYDSEARACAICAGEHRQLAEWLRELQERRKADSCEGCKNIGLWENEYENGMSCPCLRCTRRSEDNYEPERRTDG